jgi:hypothetical protein
METSIIKEKLHQFVDNGDDKLLNMLYAVANEYSKEEEFVFTSADIEEFEKRRNSRLKGESATFSWQEAKKRITAK